MRNLEFELELELELEYDLIKQNDSDVISSDDIQNNILTLVKSSENIYLYTLTPEQIFKNSEALLAYQEFDLLARDIFNCISNGYGEYLKVMLKLIKFMRHGNGLNKTLLSYCLLDILSEHNDELAKEVFHSFTCNYGCWKDVKKFYLFACVIGKEYNSPIIEYSIQLANNQLIADLENYPNDISNVAKWIPREKTKHINLYNRLVLNFSNCTNNYFKYATTVEQKRKAMNKSKMEYRKHLSKLNNALDTVQIKQCSGKWQKINPKTQTVRTLQLQANAFLNLSRNSNKMRYELSDRIICSQNFIDNDDDDDDKNNNNNNDKQIFIVNANTSFNDIFYFISKYY